MNDFQLLSGPEQLTREWVNATDTDRMLRSGDLVFGLEHARERDDKVVFEGRLSGTSDASDALYGDEFLTDLREVSSTETSSRDASLQIDITRSVAGFKLETGGRAEQRLIGTDFIRNPSVDSGLQSLQNAFDYDTRIYAGYAQASRGVGPLTFQAGGALGTLQVTPFYRVTTDLIQYFKTVDPASGISTTTFRNFEESSQLGLDVTATGRLGSRVRGMLGTNLAQVSTNAENLEAGLSNQSLSWSVRSSESTPGS